MCEHASVALWNDEFRKRAERLDDKVLDLMHGRLDDFALRARLEELARKDWTVFDGLAHRWAPKLYRRNRVVFRSLILAHLADWIVTRDGKYVNASDVWTSTELASFVKDVDRDDEVELFRKLWRVQAALEKKDEVAWRKELLARFLAANDSPARRLVLDKYNQGWRLDEDTAAALYEREPDGARAFVLDHQSTVRRTWLRTVQEPWRRLMAAARARGDDDFYFDLYRRQIPAAEWRRDVTALARSTPDPVALDAAFERQHIVWPGAELLPAITDLLRLRGEDALPWALRHLGRTVGYRDEVPGFADLKALALEREWLPLWSALLRRVARAEQFDAEVRGLLSDRVRPDAENRRRLQILAGAGSEYNRPGLGIAGMHPLTDDTAVAMLRRWPDLLRGPYRSHLMLGWGRSYDKLTSEAIAAGVDEIVDLLASRMVLQHWVDDKAAPKAIVEHFRSLRGTPGFARRAGAVLAALPAYGVWWYGGLVERNPLARLLFERATAEWLEDPAVLRDLLESPQIHVQALAFRVLGEDDERARRVASESLDLLVPTLLRPLHRRTRLLALRALANAAVDEARARVVLAKAKDAFDLPDRRYPKEHLLALCAELLHRYPALRSAREQPRVFT